MSATHYTAGLEARPRNSFFGGIGTMFAILGAARNASAAAQAGRRPAASDLRVLGIDPKSFDGVRL
ncbi:hypothetical protein RUR49_16005 [Pseudoxanthobacter sp. M-2]|uniref:hypothetical protein n=1 Tax=Pseudoxanthobacter sp. M-2 TaxID=3078754 RepID=UPI0038FCD31A